MSITYTVPLRKTYAIISNTKLTHLQSSDDDYLSFLSSLSDQYLGKIFERNLFLNSTDIPSVLRENLSDYVDSTITIVSADLFNIYLNNEKLLYNNELHGLREYITDDLPQFENIVDYEKLIDYSGSKDIEENLKTPIYRLTSSINPYNVLHIPVTKFAKMINKKEPIVIRLRDNKLLISLTYENYDLYDLAEETVDQRVE